MRITALISLTILLFCFSCKSTASVEKLSVTSEVEFVILQINDVYEIGALEGGTVGGLARVSALRKQLLEQHPHVITVLSGDFLSPSALGLAKIDGRRLYGAQMVDVLNRLGLDYVTFGNHEFDLSEENLQNRINESAFTWVSSNTFHHRTLPNGSKQVEPFIVQGKMADPVRPYDIIRIPVPGRRDVRIGMLGVCLPFNQVDYVDYDKINESARLAYDYIKDKTDAVIAMTHLNLAEDQALAHALPEVPLLMGGHEHENHIEKIGPVTIAKADANAKSAYVHYLTYDLNSRDLSVSSRLVHLDESVTPDPEVKAVVEKWVEKVRAEMRSQGFDPDEVVYQAKEALDGLEYSIRTKPTNLGRMITAAAHAANPNAQAVILNSGAIRIDDKIKGPITQYDIMRILPYGGAMVEIEIEGELLEEVLRVGLRDNIGGGGYLQTWGIEDRDNHFYIDGTRVQKGETFTILTGDFLFSGNEENLGFFHPEAGGVLAVRKPGKEDLNRDIRFALIAYMKSL